MTENELKDKIKELSLYSNELEDRIEDLEKLNTTITMENERLINEMRKLEKDNQTLMNSMVTEGHTKETEEIERLNNIINEFENRDDVLEEFEDWLERQKTRNSEWDNFIMVDGRLGIPISYLLNKLQELKGSDK